MTTCEKCGHRSQCEMCDTRMVTPAEKRDAARIAALEAELAEARRDASAERQLRAIAEGESLGLQAKARTEGERTGRAQGLREAAQMVRDEFGAWSALRGIAVAETIAAAARDIAAKLDAAASQDTRKEDR